MAHSKKPRRAEPRRTTTRRVVWRDVTCRVRHTRDYLVEGSDHVELMVLTPKGALLPITDTGYLSHFIDAGELDAAGGAVRFMLDWMEREAKSTRFRKADFKSRQLKLFE